VLRLVVERENKAVALVSHKLDEVLHATDEITIMRQGRVVDHLATREAVARSLARAMVGREVSLRSESRTEIRVFPRPGRSLIEEVGALARERGWRLAEMHGERGRLDEVFREITSGQLS